MPEKPNKAGIKNIDKYIKLVSLPQKQVARKSIKRKLSIAQICAQLGISKPTLYNYLRRQNIPRYAQKVKQGS